MTLGYYFKNDVSTIIVLEFNEKYRKSYMVTAHVYLIDLMIIFDIFRFISFFVVIGYMCEAWNE